MTKNKTLSHIVKSQQLWKKWYQHCCVGVAGGGLVGVEVVEGEDVIMVKHKRCCLSLVMEGKEANKTLMMVKWILLF